MAHELDPALVALLARATIDKAETERLNVGIEWGTVVGFDATDGVITFVTVLLNAAGGNVIHANSLVGSDFTIGKRVAVLWVAPGASYVLGSDVVSTGSDTLPYLVADATGTVDSGVTQQVLFNSISDSWPGGETVRPWREPDDGTNPINFGTSAFDTITINEDGLYQITADINWEIGGDVDA